MLDCDEIGVLGKFRIRLQWPVCDRRNVQTVLSNSGTLVSNHNKYSNINRSKANLTLMKKVLILLSVLLSAPFLSHVSFAQFELGYYLPEGFNYDPSVPTPQSVLDHEVGEWHVSHDKLVSYMYAVAAASDRVSIQEYGRTYENRPLLMLTITSPENHNRIEEIKANHLALTAPGADAIEIEDQPVVVWLGHGVHGNEASGHNSALVTLYHYAAAQGADINEVLNETVILIDPAVNPDGYNRFASWVNSHKGQNLVSDPNNLEQNEAWPRGRTNHYWFDLNRDYIPAQHPESRGRLAAIHEWKPNLYTDHHEMGTNTTFFFQPGEANRVHPLIPEQNQELTQQISDFFQAGLDEINSLYFSGERYDDYYPGRGPTYVDFNGGVAVLFEQASARGHAQDSVNGVLTFPFAIRNQHRSAISSVNAAHALRSELLSYQREYYASTTELAQEDSVKAYVFGSDKDPARVYHLAEIVKRHEIDIFHLAEVVESEQGTFEPGSSYVVPLAQQQYRLIHALFEIRNTFDDSIFYDVSAWTLPLAFNLDYQALDRREYSTSLLGDEFVLDTFPTGQLVSGRGSYAYAFELHGYYAHRAINRLLSEGVRIRVASEGFSDANGNRFDAGSIVVPLGTQEVESELIHELMETIAQEDALDVYGFDTGRSNSGPDLGSSSMSVLEQPKILILAEGGMSGYEVGQAWHLLDTRFGMQPSLVSVDTFNRISLDAYNTVVLVDGNYSGVSSNAIEKLKRWNRGGGLIIAAKQGSTWLARSGLSNVTFESMPDVEFDTPAYGDFEQLTGSQVIGGSIFRAQLDISHPLGWGFDDPELPLFKRGTLVMNKSNNPFANPIMYSANSLWSGYVPDEKLPFINNSAAVAVSTNGQGRIISFVDDPNFRAFWYGTNKLFMNSLFFGSLINPGTAR